MEMVGRGGPGREHHVDAAAVGQARVHAGPLVLSVRPTNWAMLRARAQQSLLAEGGLRLGELALALIHTSVGPLMRISLTESSSR
jgi:hypothetical protein